MAISSPTIATSVGFAGAVGLVFGSYPARHAASLDSIEALRIESRRLYRPTTRIANESGSIGAR